MEQTAVEFNPTNIVPKRKNIASIVRKHFWGYAFLVPALIVFILFLWTPIVKGMIYSVYHIDFVKGNTFVGMDNYKTVFTDSVVSKSVGNSLYYMALCLLIGFWVPILFAIAISELRRFQGFARVAAYLPNVIPVVVLYGLWRWLYDSIGPFNAGLMKLGLEQVSFLTNPGWSMISIVIMETWQQFGAAMLIYLAAVLSVPRDWYEAAEIDGAGIWQRIRFITLPSIRHLVILMFLLQIIGTSQGFQSQMALLDGGPNNTTLTFALLINKYAFSRLDYGVASAMGVLMFIVLGLVAVVQYRWQAKGE